MGYRIVVDFEVEAGNEEEARLMAKDTLETLSKADPGDTLFDSIVNIEEEDDDEEDDELGYDEDDGYIDDEG